VRKIFFAKLSKNTKKKGRKEKFQPLYMFCCCYSALPPEKEGKKLQ
jgi:hypothetical protein